MSVLGALKKIKCLFVDCNAEERADLEPLAVFPYKKYIALLARTGGKLKLFGSTDGHTFNRVRNGISLVHTDRSPELLEYCSDFSITHCNEEYVMTYAREDVNGLMRVVATSRNLLTWIIVAEEESSMPHHALLPRSTSADSYRAYAGSGTLYTASFTNKWTYSKEPVLVSIPGNNVRKPLATAETTHGTLVLYDASHVSKTHTYLGVGAAFFDPSDPEKLLWRSEKPLWEDTVRTHEGISPIGAVITDARILLYLSSKTRGFIVVSIPNTLVHTPEKRKRSPVTRHEKNPLLAPREEFFWESRCVLNPAVISGNDNRIYMLYRAIGDDGVSRIGFASSDDGIHFDDRYPYPVFALEKPGSRLTPDKQHFSPKLYPSGGSWGGCEDPRMVRIDGNIYMTYNAFDGWDFIRVALTSIDEEDFYNKKWHWEEPTYISPSGERHKNWMLFPEKIRGKFAVLHNLHHEDVDRVRVDYIDDFSTFDPEQTPFESPDPHALPSQPRAWHVRMRSPGPPPLKTDQGWLVFYHAHEKDELHRYKLGAMLLDLEDPTHIRARATAPLLEPDMWYENDWKPGIIYVCGALVKDKTLFLYYGGGDKYVCVASAPLETFLEQLQYEGAPVFSRVALV